MRKAAITGIMVILLLPTIILAFDIQPVKTEHGTGTVDDGVADFSKAKAALAVTNSTDASRTSISWPMQSTELFFESGFESPMIDVFQLPFEASGKWDFKGEVKWSDFACVDDDSAELVIGLGYMRPNSYSELKNLIVNSGGDLVNTVSMDGKIVAVIANMPHQAISAFASEAEVSKLSTYIELNMRFEVNSVPNDPNWVKQWGIRTIEADYAWNTTVGDPTVLVAVIDSGVDWNHPDLAENYAPLGYDWVNNDEDPMDDNGHGTHCAGIIAAVLNNNLGIAGLAQVRIMAEKGIDQDGMGWEDDLANAIVHAVDHGADIVSMSWGGRTWVASVLVHEAVKYAYDHGALLVASAGNENSDLKAYPAAYDEVVAVTATDEFDDPASFTNFGEWIELAAPGVDIYSTVWDDSYAYKSGTSMSCPHVAGVAALIWSQFPSMTRDQVRAQLRYTSDDLGDLGFDAYYGYGRINAKKAVELAPARHNLLVLNLRTPSYIRPSGLAIINSTILNFGTSSASNVAVQLLINGSLEDSKIIDFLAKGASKKISFSWNPTVQGTYNVTSYVVPTAGETITGNNRLSTSVTVRAAKTFRVPEVYLTVQEAIDAASVGDIIEVATGTYSEHLRISKSVTLVGQDRSTTVIDGNGTGTVVLITADNVNISGFTILNGTTGINLRHSRYNILRDINVNSNVHNFAVHGRFLLHFIHDIDMSNTVEGKPIYYLVNQNGKQVPADAGYVAVVNSTNISVRDQNLTENEQGVFFAYTADSTIENVTVSENNRGILLISSHTNNISNNEISNNEYGIDLRYSDENTVIHNIMSNGTTGIYLLRCSSNIIKENTITSNNGYGVWHRSSTNNTIRNNTVSYNNEGIYTDCSVNETICGNSVLNSTLGIYLDESSCNILRENNMVDNRYHFRVSGHLLSHFIHDIDTSNTVEGKPIYYVTNQEGLIIDPSTFPSIGYLGLVNSKNLIVKNLNLTEMGQGLLLAYTNNSLIENVASSNNNYGFYLCGSSGNNISKSKAANNTVCGVYLKSGSHKNVISGNTVSNNEYGIVSSSSCGNVLRNNNMTGNRYNFGVDGHSLSHFVQDIDSSNTVDGKPMYYWVNQHSQTIPADAGYVAVINSTSVTVKNVDLVKNFQGLLLVYTANSTIMNVTGSYNYNGIYLWNSGSNTISGNNVTNNVWGGIELYYSDNNTIADSTVTDCVLGIHVTESNRNFIDNNTLSRNTLAISLYYSDDNILSGNKVTGGVPEGRLTGSLAGISLTESKRNVLSGNTVSDNLFYVGAGIYLEWSSNNNTIIQNTITNNTYGISVGYWNLQGLKDQNNNNTIYHNDFVTNTNQVLSLNSINTWHDSYPSGGNYWSDYNGTDINHDGLGDTPYVIDEYNQDMYPLMSPWRLVSGDINRDGIVNIYDIVAAVMSFGASPEHAHWNPVADMNQDGVVDIFDLVLIAINFGKPA